MLTALARALPARPRPAIAPGLLDYAASALGDRIEAARQQAIADGVRPMPVAVSRGLLGYFPPTLLQRCRFATENCRAVRLAALDFAYGDPTSVTLGDVILFKSDRFADANLRAWAHELTHVMQFQRWGVGGFASRYVRDSAAVEQEAIDNASRFADWQGGRLVP